MPSLLIEGMKYNEENGITPRTIVKDVYEIIEISAKSDDEKSISKMSRKEREVTRPGPVPLRGD